MIDSFLCKAFAGNIRKKEERELLAGYWASGNFARTVVAFLPLYLQTRKIQNGRKKQETFS